MTTRPNHDPIVSTLAALPTRCPTCWYPTIDRTRESGHVRRLTCARCHWSERYAVDEARPVLWGGDEP